MWLALNLRARARRRSATCGRSSRRARGSRCRCPAGGSCGRIALGALAIVVAVLIGLYAVVAVGDVARLAQRGAVRPGRSDPRPRRRLLRLLAAVPAAACAASAQALVVLAALGAGALYLVSGSLTSRLPRPAVDDAGARGGICRCSPPLFLLLLAFGAWLQPRRAPASQPSALIYGASYADVHGRMPAALLLVAASASSAPGSRVLQAFTPRNWPIPAGGRPLSASSSIGGEVYSTLLQRFVVTPNEQTRETPFIQHNIDATRRAFALDRVEERELSGDALLTRADIARNAATLENVRLWDHQPLLETFGQIQEIRTYYDFVVGRQRPLPRSTARCGRSCCRRAS